ncbi:MAG: hypothetical protein RLZZ272_1486 [Actinomycetota bacterium]
MVEVGARFDVAVIGAGIMGAACAHELVEAGLRVVVLERAEAPATGSTGHSAAGVRVQFVEPTNVALSLASIGVYADFERRFGVDSGYRPVGYLLLVGVDAWASHLEGVRIQRELGAPVDVLDVDEAVRRVGGLVTDGLAGATYGPIDGVVDPHGITFGYLDAARRGGAVLRLRTEVVALDRDDAGWLLRCASPAGTTGVRAGAVVNAAGAWAGAVGALAGRDVPVVPMRRMVFMTAAREGRATTPLTVDLTTGLYYRSEGERLLFGRSNHDEVPGFHAGIDWDWLVPTLDAAVGRFPWFADETFDRGACWAGYYEQTPDENAVLGADPADPTWLNACGFSGHGVQQAPAVARAIREELVDGRAHTIPIDPLRVDRFLSGRVVTERHII